MKLLLGLVWGALVLFGAVGNAALAESNPVLTQMELNVVGLGLQAEPAYQAVPKGITSIVKTGFDTGSFPVAEIIAQLPADYTVRAELSGPSLSTPVTLVAKPGKAFELPTLTIFGTYTLANIRLVDGAGQTIMGAVPQAVAIESIPEPLITSVTTRQLSLDELKERGVTFDSSNFTAYEFTAGLATSSGQVPIKLPVVVPAQNPVWQPIPGLDHPAPAYSPIDSVLQIPPEVPESVVPQNLSVEPFMMEVPLGDPASKVSLPPIPGVVAIPGNIGFLHQYFSALVLVSNGAPGMSGLTIKDVKAKIVLPVGEDQVADAENAWKDDPIRMAKGAAGFFPKEMAVANVGADGKYGTADDVGSLKPSESGQADFTIEGMKEGTHKLDFEITATLEGLPIGPVEIKGKASGAVLVRNPDFALTFGHPATVRSGEEYDLFVTVTNTSQTVANLVSVRLDRRAVSGAAFVEGETEDKSIETILPGSAATVKFRMKSQRTGKVTATAFESDQVKGRFNLRTGVGELGIPLSPDSLILPYTGSLPGDLVTNAVGFLGQAWSVATAPSGSLPSGMLPISKQMVSNEAYNLSEAGLRILIGDTDRKAIADLTLDFFGSDVASTGFDSLRRKSTMGLLLNQSLGAFFGGQAAKDGVLKVQSDFADKVSYRPGHISVIASEAPVRVSLSDESGNRTGTLSAEAALRGIPYADQLVLSDNGSARSTLTLASKLESASYLLELSADNQASFDLGIVVPDGSNTLRQLRFSGVTMPAGGKARLTLKPGTDAQYRLSFDDDGDGTVDRTSDQSGVTVFAERAPQVVAAARLFPGYGPGGDKHGRNVAVLFSERVTVESAKNVANYLVDGNEVKQVTAQPGNRMAFLLLRDGIGPFVERSVTVSGITDTNGNTMTAPVAAPIKVATTAPAAKVTGTVRSANSKPLPGSIIKLLQLAWYTDPLTGELEPRYAYISEKEVNADGSFAFDFVLQNDDPAGPFMLEAVNPEGTEVAALTTGVIYDGQELNLDMYMMARGAVTGVVRNESGQPVGGASVLLTTLADNRKYITTSDGQGVFSFTGAAVGAFDLKGAHVPTLSEGTIMGLLPQDGKTVTQDLTLYSTATIKKGNVTGKVFDSDGVTPRAGAIVILRANYYQNWMRSGADGSFAFNGVYAGEAELEVRYDATGENRKLSGSVAEGKTSVFNVILEGVGEVTGKVRREDGKSVENLYIVAESRNIKKVVRTNATGDFRLAELPVGDILVNCLDPQDFNRTIATGAVTLMAANSTANLNLYVPKSAFDSGTIKGTVYKRDGSVWAEAPVRRVVDETHYFPVKVDEIGKFELPNLPLGSYDLIVLANGEVINATAKLWYSTQVKEIELRPFGIGTVTGTVYDDAEMTIPTGADVTLISLKPDAMGYLRYDPDFRTVVKSDPQTGRFSFKGVYEGSFTVLSSNIFRPVAVSVSDTLVGDKSTKDVKLALKAPVKPGDPPPVNSLGSVSGTVYTPTGSVAGEDIEVSVFYGGAYVKATTDDQGRFQTAKLVPAGNQRVMAFDPVTSYTWEGYVAIPNGLDVPINITLLGKGSLTVRVLDGNKPAAAGVKVEVIGSDYPFNKADGRTEADGTIRFDNLFQGRYAVVATGNFGIGGRASGVIAADGANASVDVRLAAYGTIAGRFLAADRSTPVKAGQIRLIKDGGVIAYAVSSSDAANEGSYVFEHVPLGNFTLEGIDHTIGRMGLGGGRINSDRETVLSDIVVIPQGTVKGNVLNYSGTAPVRGALVSVSVSGLSSYSYNTVTAPDGSFVFTGVPAGRFHAEAKNPVNGLYGYASSSIGYEGETASVKLNIAPSGSIEGTIFRQDGKTWVANATVALNGKAPTPVSTESGSFRFDNLAAGSSYTLTAVETGTLRAGKRITTITADGDVAQGDISLSGIGTVEGTVYETGYNGAGLTPLEGAVVHMQARGYTSVSYTANTDAEGKYQFINVPAGTFTMQVNHTLKATGASGSGTLTREGEKVTVDMTLGQVASLKGRVLLSDGTSPSQGSGVSMTASNGRVYTGITDSNGVYTFLNIPIPCSYTLYMEDLRGLGVGKGAGSLTENGRLYDAGDTILDDTPLTVVDMDPVANSVDVPLNKYLKVRFSKPVKPATVNSGTVYLLKGGERVAGGVSLDADNRGATFTSTAPFSGFTLYSLVVSNGITDLLDRPLPKSYTSVFTTIDNVAPSVAGISPANGAIEVATDGVVRIVFSEAIDQSAMAGIKLTQGLTTVPTRTDATLGGRVVILTPLNPLAANTAYSVSISGVRDLVPIPNYMPGSFASAFQTVDTVTPGITSLTVAPDADLVKGNAVAVTAVTDSADTALVDYFIDNVRVATASKAPFTANVPLTKEGLVSIKAVAQDKAGNRGLPAYLELTAKANQPPTVEFVAPEEGAQVSAGSTITVQVKAVDDLSASQVTLKATGELVYDYSRNNDQAGKTFTAAFSLKIPEEITRGGAIVLTATGKDKESNASLPVQRTLFVRDGLAPVLTVTSAGQTVKYRPGQAGSVQFKATDNVAVTGLSCSVTGAASGGTNLSPSPALKETTGSFAIQVAPNAAPFAEIAVNCSAWDALGNTGSSTVKLLVADVVPPQVTEITPAAQKTNVSRFAAATVRFDEPVDTATVTAARLLLTLDGVEVPGAISFAENNTLAVFRAAAPLKEESEYLLTVKGGIADLSGNVLASDRSSAFTTGKAASTRVVYYDANYPSSMISRTEALAYRNFLLLNGFTEVDANGLREFMTASDAGSVVVAAQDILPDTVYDQVSTFALVRRYLDNGGTVVWMQNQPFCYQGHYGSTSTDTCADAAGMKAVLGVANGTFDRNDAVTLTSEGLKLGLSKGWSSSRPVSASGVTRVLAASSGGAAAWQKNFNPAYPESGFIRIWDNGGEFTSRGYLDDLLAVTGVKPVVTRYPELVARLAMEGDFTDASGNGYHGVPNGGAAFTSDKVKGASAGSFKGAADYLSLGNLYGNFPDNQFAVEAWVKVEDTGNGARRTIAGGTGAAADYAIGLAENQFAVFAGNGSTVNAAKSGLVPNPGQWYHLAGTYDGSKLRVYVNGELKNTVTAGWSQAASGADFRVGESSCCGGTNFNGIIDDLAIYRFATAAETVREHYYAGISGEVTPVHPPVVNPVPATTYANVLVLTGNKDAGASVTVNGKVYVPVGSATQWSTLYLLKPGVNVLEITSRDAAGNGSTPVTVTVEVLAERLRDQDLIGLWHLDGNWSDFSGAANHAYPVNGAALTSDAVGGTSAASFSASRYASVGSLYGQFPSNSFTVEAWVKAADNGAGARKVIAGATGGNADYGIGLNESEFVAFSGDKGKIYYAQSGVIPEPGAWYHLAGTYDRGRLKIYVNGNFEFDMPAGWAQNATGTDFRLGGDGGANGFNGTVDEVVLHRRALTDAEIAASYRSGARIAMSSPGLSAKFKPGETGSVSVEAESERNLTGIYCEALGAAQGTSYLALATPQRSASHDFAITVNADAAPYAAVEAHCYVQDESGRTGTGILKLNTADVVAPAVTGSSIADGTAGLALNTSVTLSFSEAMAASSLNSDTVLLSAGAGEGSPLAVNLTVAADGKSLTVKPAALLGKGTGYMLTLTSGVTDLAGNALAAAYVLTFATDGASPTVTSSSVANNSSNLPVGQSFSLAFSESIAAASVNDASVLIAPVADPSKALLLDLILSADRKSLVVKPVASLSRATAYRLTLTGAVSDDAGNGLAEDYLLNFSTDGSAPTVIASSVADGAGNLPVMPTLTVTLSETLALESVNSTSVRLTGAADPATPIAVSIGASTDRKSITVKPVAALARSTAYSLTLSTGITDVAGNALEAPYQLTFSVDGTGPSVTGSSVPAGSTSLALNPAITLYFDEALSSGSVNAASVLLTQVGAPGSLLPAQLTLSGDRKALTVKPSASLLKGEAYALTVTTAVTDEAGNGLAAPYLFNFTTDGTPPNVVSTSPAIAADKVAIDSAVSFTFAEPVDPASVGAASVLVSSEFGQLSGNVSLSADNRTVSFRPSGTLAYNRQYLATLKAGISDAAGNATVEDYTVLFRSEPAPSDLAGLWRMEGDFADASGGGNALTPLNVSFSSDSRVGSYAAGMSGNSYLYNSAPNGLGFTGNFTVSGWIKPESAQAGGIIDLGQENGGGWEIRYEADRSISYRHNAGRWQGLETFSTQASSVPTGAWLHFALVYGDRSAKLYLNGQQAAAKSFNYNPVSEAGYWLEIGASRPGSDEFFAGLIDEMALHKRALTADEVAELYQSAVSSDKTAPAAPTVNTIPASTSASALILSGSKEAGASVRINGREVVAHDGGNSWQAVYPLQPGQNVLDVTSRDASGNESATTTVATEVLLSGKVDSALIGQWPMDGSWFDYSGNGNRGLAAGGAGFSANTVTGSSSGSFTAPGASVGVANSALLHSERELTVTGWVFVNRFDKEWQAIFWKGNNSGCSGVNCESQEYALWLNANGSLSLQSTPKDKAGIATLSAATPSAAIQSGRWHFVSAVVSANDNYLRVFVDGDQKANWIYSNAGIRTSDGNLIFGNSPSGANTLNGNLAALTIYNRALSTEEIRAAYRRIPRVTLSSPGELTKYRPGDSGTVSLQVSDDGLVKELYCRASGAASGTLSAPVEPPQAELIRSFPILASGSALSGASMEIRCWAKDDAGSLGSAGLTLSVADVVAPTVTGASIADNSVNLPLDQTVTVSFSEAMSAATLNADNVLFSAIPTAAAVPVILTPAADGKSLLVKPVSPLVKGTSYLLTVTGRVTDLADNHLAADYQLRFTTDTGAPYVTGASIVDNAGNLPLNPSITVTFNEALAASSVNASTVTLTTAADTSSAIAATLTVSTDRRSITVKPVAALEKATSYVLTASEGITDAAANALAAAYRLRFATDGTAPSVTACSVANNATGLPLNPTFTLTFSETVAPASVNASSVRLATVADPENAVPVTLVVAGDRLSLTVKPAGNLLKSTTYRLTVGTGVTDDAGNALAQAYTLQATTDGTPPTVTGASIANNTGNLPLNQSVTLTFSEALAASSVNADTVFIRSVADQVRVAAAATLSSDRKSVTVRPTANLAKATSYELTVTTGVTDEPGNALAAQYLLSFSTDGTAPAVVATSIPQDSTNVPLNAAITLTFNEVLAVSSVNGSSVLLTSAADPATAIAASVTLSADRKSVTVKPSANLSRGGAYSITVTGGVTDEAGNGCTPPYRFAFSVDATPPTVTATSLVEGASNLPLDPSITLSFSEALALSSVTGSTLTLSPASDLSVKIPLIFTLSTDHRTVTVTVKASSKLAKATGYLLTATTGVTDEAGNGLAAPYLLTFSTDGTPPAVTASAVSPNEINNLPRDPVFTLTFSEPLAAGSISSSTVAISAAADPASTIAATATLSADRRTLTVRPSVSLAKAASYYLILTTGVTDEAGNGLAADYRLAFATDGTAPTVVASTVAEGAGNLPLSQSVTLTFSETVAAGTVNASTVLLTTSADLNTVAPSTLALAADRKSLTVTPVGKLLKGTSYALRLTSAITDEVGNPLSPYRLNFATDGTAPTVVTSSMANNATDVSLNPTVTFTFSEPLAASSVNTSTVALVKSADLTAVPVTIALSADRRTLGATPSSNLLKGTSYLLTLTSGVSDDAGNNMAAYSVNFTTDGTPPVVVSVTPAADSVDVPTGASVIVRFNEAIDAASVTSSAVSLATGEVPITGAVTVSNGGLLLTFKPYNQLALSRKYNFVLKAGIRDISGNATLSDLTTSFTTQGPDTDLVGYWPMDGDWKDYSGKGHDGVPVNGPSFTADHIGGTQGGSFKGGGDYLSVGNLYGSFPNNTFTIESWVKLEDTGNGARRTIAGGVGSGADYAIGLIDNQFTAYTYNSSGYYAKSGFTPTVGTWYHVAGTFDGSRIKLYVNGDLVGELAGSWGQSNGGANFWIGQEACCGNNFNGLIDEVSLYKRPLKEEDIFEHYNAGLSEDRTSPDPPTVEPVAGYTYVNNVVLRGTKEAGTSIRINGSQVVAHDSTTTWQLLYPLSLGQNLLDITSRDLAGNASVATTVAVNLQPSEPGDPVRTPPTVAVTSPGQSTRYKAGETGTATVTAASADGISKLYCNADGAVTEGSLVASLQSPLREATRDFSFKVTADAKASAPIGISCIAETATGARSSVTLDLLAADMVAPQASITSPGEGSQVNTGSSFSVAVQGTDESEVKSVTVTVDGEFHYTETKTVTTGKVFSTTFNITTPVAIGGDGSIVVTVFATDGVGNVSQSATRRLVLHDSIAPTVTLTSPGQTVKYRPGEAAQVNVAISDNMGATVVNCYCYGAATTSQTFNPPPKPGESLAFNFTVPFDALPNASITTVCTAFDAANNSSTATLVLNVADTVPPTVTGTVPASNATDIPTNASFSFGFSEPLRAATVSSASVMLVNSANGSTIPVNVTLSPDRKSITVYPSALLSAGATYTLTVSTAITDDAGNALAAPYQLRFTCDNTPPTVVSTTPTSGTVAVSVATSISFRFSEPIDPSSAAASLVSLTSATGMASGSVTVSSDGLLLIFKPDSQLNYSTVYTFYLKAGIRDISGNTSNGTSAATFTTDVDPNPVYTNGTPWSQQYKENLAQSGDLTGWGTGPSLPSSKAYATSFVTTNRVYVVGGNYSPTVVYSAPIDASGTIGTWTTDTPIPVGLNNAKSIVTNSRVYLIGGQDTACGVSSNAVYSAKINADGRLGAWMLDHKIPADPTGLEGVDRPHVVVTKNRVYAIGGISGGVHLSSIRTAPINPDGTLGAWTMSSSSLPTGISFGQLVSTKNRLYLLGGRSTDNSGGSVSSVYTAPINADGTLGTWTSTTPLPTALALASSVVVNQNVYLLGGYNGTVLSSVYRAPINADGTLGAWVSGTTMPLNLAATTAIITSSKLYVFAGISKSSSTAVYYVPFVGGSNDYVTATGTNLPTTPAPDPPPPAVNPGGPNTYVNGTPWKQQANFNSAQAGNITGWTSGAPLAYPIRDPAVVVTNKRVYLLAGDLGNYTPTAHTQSAVINDDGTLGPWTQGADLPAVPVYNGYPRAGSAVLLGNRVYWMVGTQLVYSALVNSDGSLGTWRAEPNTFSRSDSFVPIVTKNKVYLLSSGARSAPILTDGTIGTWGPEPKVGNNIGYSGADFLFTGSRIYGFAGNAGYASNASVSAVVNSDGTMGGWVAGSNLPFSSYYVKTVVTGKTAYLISGAAVYSAPVNADGTLGAWAAGTSLPGSTYQVGVFVTGSRIYVVGGGDLSYTTSYTTVYSAPFQGGSNSYMDKTYTTP